MNSLQIAFPAPWSVLRGGAAGRATAVDLVEGMAELGAATQNAAREFFAGLVSTLDRTGVEALASLVVQTPDAATTVQAFCALAVLDRGPGPCNEALLREVAESGPHPGLERRTTMTDLPVGRAARSSAFRHAAELVDAEGIAPYAAELRFVFPVDDDRVAVLHFETLSLVYLTELTGMFDAIAGTTRVA